MVHWRLGMSLICMCAFNILFVLMFVYCIYQHLQTFRYLHLFLFKLMHIVFFRIICELLLQGYRVSLFMGCDRQISICMLVVLRNCNFYF